MAMKPNEWQQIARVLQSLGQTGQQFGRYGEQEARSKSQRTLRDILSPKIERELEPDFTEEQMAGFTGANPEEVRGKVQGATKDILGYDMKDMQLPEMLRMYAMKQKGGSQSDYLRGIGMKLQTYNKLNDPFAKTLGSDSDEVNRLYLEDFLAKERFLAPKSKRRAVKTKSKPLKIKVGHVMTDPNDPNRKIKYIGNGQWRIAQ